MSTRKCSYEFEKLKKGKEQKKSSRDKLVISNKNDVM